MNKTQKLNCCRKILYSYELNQALNDKDYSFMIYILSCHPNWLQKSYNGVKSIKVIKDSFNGRCFAIVDNNDQIFDISFMKAINKPNKINEIIDTCRSIIYPAVKDYKLKNFSHYKTNCAICKRMLFLKDTHVDHYDLTFQDLFNKWIKDKNIDYLYSQIPFKHNEIQFYRSFDNEQLNKDFYQFHNKNTHLRLVCKKCNLSYIKRLHNFYNQLKK